MKRLALWAFLLSVAVGCGKGDSEPGKKTADLTPVPELSAYSLGSPIQSGSLSVVPVVYKEPIKGGDDYATLAEAMKNGWIEIIEKPGGLVDTLTVRNTGPKPLLLLGGELLIGGKQDRVVCKDVIIQPGKTEDVAVNCVEHGRWEGSSMKFKPAGTMVPLSVRERANYETQQDVWNKVGDYNAAAKASPERTTIQAGLANEEVKKRMTGDLQKIVSAMGAHSNVVGVIIAIDGKPQTLELFGSPALFSASQGTILKGALAEVALSGKSSAMPSMSDCQAFFVECLNADRRMKAQRSGINSFSADSSSLRGAEIGTSDYEAKPASKQEGLVHGTYSRAPGK